MWTRVPDEERALSGPTTDPDGEVDAAIWLGTLKTEWRAHRAAWTADAGLRLTDRVVLPMLVLSGSKGQTAAACGPRPRN